MKTKPKPWTSMSAEGRDALVAEKVMGWKLTPPSTAPYWVDSKKGIARPEHDFQPSTSIAAAFEVVNALQKRGLRMVMFHRENLAWECRFDNHQSGVSFEAPEAICLAALRAHNVEVE